MVILIITLILFTGIGIEIIKRVRYKQTEYFAITHNSYGKTMSDDGLRGEYFVYDELKDFPGNTKFLFNVYIPKTLDQEVSSEIDVIFLHNSGIYVIESKNYSGWIFWNENQNTWTATYDRGNKVHFYNPIKQNDSHIFYLKLFLWIDKNIPYHSIIAFSDRCTLKNITLTSKKHKIINRYNIYKTIKQRKFSQELSDDDIEIIYEKLFPLTQKSDEYKEKHIENIKNIRKSFSKKFISSYRKG